MLILYKNTIEKVITMHLRLHDNKKMRKVFRNRTVLCLVEILIIYIIHMGILQYLRTNKNNLNLYFKGTKHDIYFLNYLATRLLISPFLHVNCL